MREEFVKHDLGNGMKLSVVLACYNGENTLADQFEGLVDQQWSEPWELVFVDNGSTDNSRGVAEQYQGRLPSMKIVDASEQQGKSFALNKGIQVAEGESIAFVDADDQVAPGWLPAIGNALLEHALVATRCDVDTLNNHDYSAYRGTLQAHGPQSIHYPPYLPHAAGGTIGIRRSLHDDIGGFDESLRYLEDTDYIWKAQMAGVDIHFVEDAVMRMRYRETLLGIYRQKRNYAEYNVLLYKRYRQHGDPIPTPWHDYFAGWTRLIRSLRHLRRPSSRADWVGHFGTMVGKTKGVLKYQSSPT